MRDRPNGFDLSELAERVQAGDAAIDVPDDQRYRDLMLASARAIAGRQEETGDAPERDELRSLTQILEKEAALADLNLALTAAIRGGAYDPAAPGHDAVRNHLWQTALNRVRESNPKALPKDD